jgi:hypothetical protein
MTIVYKDLFHAVAKRPGMYLVDESLDCYVSFIAGYNAAYHEKPLSGFREWLVKKRYIGNNQIWEAAAFKITANTEEERISLFHQLISEYFELTKKINLEN